jgi:hypothetical protein
MNNSVSLPYIGCRISLVSKSDIRYEGILYGIDPNESTVALSQVRSLGTEGRKKEGQQIPPSNEIFDYILFKSHDIKEITVLEPAVQYQQQALPNNDPKLCLMEKAYREYISGFCALNRVLSYCPQLTELSWHILCCRRHNRRSV